MSFFRYPPVSLSVNGTKFLLDGVVTDVEKDTATPANSIPLPVENLDSDGNPDPANLKIVDMLDVPLQDNGTLAIPGSASAPEVVVASLAARARLIRSQDVIGEFLGVYSDPLGVPVLICILGPGGSAKEVNIPAGTVIGLKNMNTAALSTAGDQMIMEFFG